VNWWRGNGSVQPAGYQQMCDRRIRDLKRQLTALAGELGCSVKIATTNGGHIRATFSAGNRSAHVFSAFSPSDWRNWKNVRADARRAVRRLQTTGEAA
jgi:hypothetical protein